MVIKSVGAVSCAKVAGALYALIGLIAGAFMSLIGLAGVFASSDGGGAIGALFGVGAIVLLPIVYGVFGFVTTFIAAALYNVIAGRVGGIEINVQ
jgi:hypothetical protein